jgi:vitamin B12 transporter
MRGPFLLNEKGNVMRFSSVFWVSCSVVALALPCVAQADEGEQIVVTATRSETPLSAVGQSVSVIDASDIARLQMPSVAELLRTVPGVSVAANGGLGSQTSIFIRGAASEHTVALIDGVKINDPSSPAGGFNFGNLLSGNVERIELVRGAQSVLWGSQASRPRR